MKKILVYLLAVGMLAGMATSASAHGGWRGGYGGYHEYEGHGGWHTGWRGGWVPFAVGAVAGVAVASAYNRSAPYYYAPQYVYAPPPQTAAFCPENGLYYPQTQACPSGWQRVRY